MSFRILYLRDHVLQSSELLTEADLLDAIDRASEKVHGTTAEVWSDRGKVGIIDGTSRPVQGKQPIQEAAITSVMRARLDIAHNADD